MNPEGLWTEEHYGMFGWENRGVVVLQGGRVMGGGNNHFVVGSYQVDGETIGMNLNVEYHGTPRAQFGTDDRSFTLELSGRLVDGTIEAEIHRPDRTGLALPIRLTRRTDLPPTKG